MVDTKISGATDISTLATTDVIPVGRPASTTAYKATMAEVKNAAAPGFNVKQYGAVGDGVTDDTAAIQAAVDAVRTAEGGKLYFPAGKYKTTSTITFNISRPSQTGQHYSLDVCGDGGASLIYNTAVDGTDCFYFISQVGDMATLHIHDLAFEGAGAFWPTPANTGNCLHLRRCIMPAQIDNVYITKFGGGAGIKLQSTWCTQVNNTRIFYCQYGVYTLNDSEVGLWGSSVNHSHICCDYSGNDIGIYNGAAHMNIDNCIIEGNVSHGISMTACSHAYINNIYLETNGEPDIELINCQYATVKNVTGTSILLDSNCTFPILEQNEFTTLTFDGSYGRAFGTLLTGTGAYNIKETPPSWTAFAANDATPSVAFAALGYKIYATVNTVPTTITNFDNGYSGQEIWVKVHDAFTSFDFSSSALVGNDGSDYTADNGDMIHAIMWNNYWYCNIIKA